MAQIDSSSGRPKNADPTRQMGGMIDWISQQVAQINQAEARIEKRVQHLAAAEQGLKTLFELLRTQTAHAYQVMDALKQAVAAADQYMLSQQQKFAATIQSQRNGLTDELHRQLESIQQESQQAIDIARQQIRASLDEMLNDAAQQADSHHAQLVERVKSMLPQVEQAAHAELSRRIATIESEMNTAADWIDQLLLKRVEGYAAEARKTIGEQLSMLRRASQSLRHHSPTDAPARASATPVQVQLDARDPAAQTGSAT